MSRARRTLLLLPLTLVVRCRPGPGSAANVDGRMTVELRLPVAPALRDRPEARRLFIGEREVAFAEEGGSWVARFETGAAGGLPSPPPLEAMSPGLCGWTRMALRVTLPDAVVARHALDAGKPVPLRALRGDPEAGRPTLRLFVDNRGRPADVLHYGTESPLLFGAPVAADGLARLEIPRPACASRLWFALGDAAAEPAPALAAGARAYWLDPGASRCYVEEARFYSRNHAYGNGQTLGVHTPARWHAMRMADDYILEEPPAKIAEPDETVDSRKLTVWEDRECRGGSVRGVCEACARGDDSAPAAR